MRVCKYRKCRLSLEPSNAATNFSNPAYSVKQAFERRYIKENKEILDFGSGNLRNFRFIAKSGLKFKSYWAFDLDKTMARFPREYEEFRSLGGTIARGMPQNRGFDIVICTYVIETICPREAREHSLYQICKVLRPEGMLVISFRGYPGVRGTKYKVPPCGEGFISPKKTFIKPFLCSEANDMLNSIGFANILFLQKYRVNKPENIHLIARKE